MNKTTTALAFALGLAFAAPAAFASREPAPAAKKVDQQQLLAHKHGGGKKSRKP